jgi:hypothetical protein
MTIALDVMRKCSAHDLMPAFRQICRTDLEAASMAVEKGWAVDPDPAAPPRTPGEIAHVEQTAREAVRTLSRPQDQPARPERVAFVVPPATLQAARYASPVVHRARAASALPTPEQLAAE